jgi:hypothetical protein
MSYEAALFWMGLIGIGLYGLLHVVYITLRYPVEEWARRLMCSASYPQESLPIAVFEELSTRWKRWRKRSVRTMSSPRRRYAVDAFVAAGDLCDAHVAKANHADYLLKIPRTTNGESLLRQEVEILGELHTRAKGRTYAKYLPRPIERFRHGGQFVTAMAYEPGFQSARDLRGYFPLGMDGRHLAWMLNRTLEILGFVHECGYVHAGVLPTHLLFHAENHAGKLIGWTHAVRRGHLVSVVPGEYRHWYPGECVRKEGVEPATDIYLAAMTMLWLSGGNVETKKFPDAIPRRFQDVLLRCLEERLCDRPQDAWELHRELRTVFEHEYGKPRFQELWV